MEVCGRGTCGCGTRGCGMCGRGTCAEANNRDRSGEILEMIITDKRGAPIGVRPLKGHSNGSLQSDRCYIGGQIYSQHSRHSHKECYITIYCVKVLHQRG